MYGIESDFMQIFWNQGKHYKPYINNYCPNLNFKILQGNTFLPILTKSLELCMMKCVVIFLLVVRLICLKNYRCQNRILYIPVDTGIM